MFGCFGGQLNLTDGRYVYMRAPRIKEMPKHYTLAGIHSLRQRIFSEDNKPTLSIREPFSFTKGMPVMEVGNMPNSYQTIQNTYEDMLFYLENDPAQNHPFRNADVEARFCREASRLFKQLDAPAAMYDYYGLSNEEE